jgi:hypothetical protein
MGQTRIIVCPTSITAMSANTPWAGIRLPPGSHRSRNLADKQARASEINRVIEAGPPAASSITRKAWRDWHHSGFVVCPVARRPAQIPIAA